MLCVGCGQKLVPVSGHVTLDGKALPNATLLFSPDSDKLATGPGSVGKTDNEGSFSLQLMSGNDKGAVPGSYKVTISAYDDDGGPNDSSKPKSRKLIVKMEKQFDVPAAGTTEANFELTSPQK
jgi:hypothetical protein